MPDKKQPITKEMDIRQKSMLWWMHLTEIRQNELCGDFFEGRKSDSLTGREIQIIYNKTFNL